MANGKLFGLLTGAQVTIIALGAMFAPAGLYAAVTYSNIAIVNPATGVSALVDGAGRLYTYDPIAGYANNPHNSVEIAGFVTSTTTLYTVPVGKALILKSANISYYNGTAGADNYAYFYGGSSVVAGFDDTNSAGTHPANFGNGFYLESGQDLFVNTALSTVFCFEGYLVPSSAVPAAGTSEAAERLIQVGGHPIK